VSASCEILIVERNVVVMALKIAARVAKFVDRWLKKLSSSRGWSGANRCRCSLMRASARSWIYAVKASGTWLN
jgi:hypothetical protein